MSQPISTAPYDPDLEPAVIDDGGNAKTKARIAVRSPATGARDDLAGPIICLLGSISAVGVFGFALFYLSQPAIYPNPGLAAYTPPAATRLVPLPRISDAPEVASEQATLGDEPPSAETALAQAQKPTKESDPSGHEHARALPHQSDPRAFGYSQPWDKFGYAQQWNGRYRDSSFNRGGGARPRMSGGPKSSF
jgi:hypothetical protein